MRLVFVLLVMTCAAPAHAITIVPVARPIITSRPAPAPSPRPVYVPPTIMFPHVVAPTWKCSSGNDTNCRKN